MKIVKAKPAEYVDVETDESFANTYVRYGPDAWWMRIGDSYEVCYDPEDLEQAYQDYLKS